MHFLYENKLQILNK